LALSERTQKRVESVSDLVKGDCSRREFLVKFSALGVGACLGLDSGTASAEPPPETTTLKMIFDPGISAICYAPQFVAEELLRAEGFKNIRYVKLVGDSETTTIASGQADINADFAASTVLALDRGSPITVLSGLHVGCMEVVSAGRVKTIRELRGKTLGLSAFGGPDHILMSSMLAYVGIDPRKDVKWALYEPLGESKILAEEKVDAIVVFPPRSQELRAQKIGHVVVDTATDKPWSQYFCCLVVANLNFARQYPIATKRALRALLKGADLCAQDPARAARDIVDKGFAPNYEHALATLRGFAYNRWRTDNPDSTLRFHALRLRDIGMIKTNPNTLITRAGDWRLLRDLQKELKA
jgi:NitT/TauT family transport system substrate-binding protein